MAKIEIRTRNGDVVTVEENDRTKIEQLETSPFDDASNVSSAWVTNT